MRSPLTAPSAVSAMSLAATDRSAQQFLIPPFERLRFSLLFSAATGIGWLLIWLVFHSIQDPVLLRYLAGQGLLASFVGGLVSGMIVSATQWVVLRRYLPDWLWILASTAGYVLLTTTMEAWWGWIRWAMETLQASQLLNGFSPDTLPTLSAMLQVLVSASCTIWLGVAQWLLLRQYTRASYWWIGVPAMAVLLSSSLAALSGLLLMANIILPLDTSVLGAGILGTTQAIAVCALYRKTTDRMEHDRTLPLNTAPEIRQYGLVQSLARQLRRQVSQTWNGKLQPHNSLTYLVGMTEGGAIAGFCPIHQRAIDQVLQTPLPNLVIPELANRADGTPQPLARFNLSFMPSGRLHIQAWRGTPLTWLALGMITTVIVLSAFAAYFARFAVDFN